MASNPDLVQYIIDQCSGAGEVTARKMFGDYCVYCNGIFFALVSDNRFYIKPTEAASHLLRTEVPEPPYEGAKPYFYIEEIDDRDYLAALVKATCAALPLPKPKKKAAKKTL
jgi:TfoX/Sxy family transcriptional regulator of competence genes